MKTYWDHNGDPVDVEVSFDPGCNCHRIYMNHRTPHGSEVFTDAVRTRDEAWEIVHDELQGGPSRSEVTA